MMDNNRTLTLYIRLTALLGIEWEEYKSPIWKFFENSEMSEKSIRKPKSIILGQP